MSNCGTNHVETDQSGAYSSTLLPLKTDPEDLHGLVKEALERPYFSGILLWGPSGVGKTTLAKSVSAAQNRPVFILTITDLYSSAAGDVEENVDALFAKVVNCAPALVLIDNVDTLLPSNATGPADYRAIAAVNAAMDGLFLDEDDAAGVVILGTATDLSSVHPVFLRAARFSMIVQIRPPDWSERRAFLEFKLLEIQHKKVSSAVQVRERKDRSGEETQTTSLQGTLDDLASMTPGFLLSDLSGLLSTALQAMAGTKADGNSEVNALLARHMADNSSRVRPIMLTCAGAAWHPLPWDPEIIQRLHGITDQITLLAASVRSVFPWTLGSTHSQKLALDALGTIGGVLLHGPAGSGKTSLARAAPAFLPRGFVNAFVLDSCEIVGSVVGLTERKLRELFAIARGTSPSILVIENIDILAARRLDEGSHHDISSGAAAFERILSTLLIELDGVVSHNHPDRIHGRSGVSGAQGHLLVIATCTDIERLDPAILRPGRLEVHIELCLPDADARENIVRDFIHRLPPDLQVSLNVVDDRNFTSWLKGMAKRTIGWSGAEILGLCNEAVLDAARQLLPIQKVDPINVSPRLGLTRSHFENAIG